MTKQLPSGNAFRRVLVRCLRDRDLAHLGCNAWHVVFNFTFFACDEKQAAAGKYLKVSYWPYLHGPLKFDFVIGLSTQSAMIWLNNIAITPV